MFMWLTARRKHHSSPVVWCQRTRFGPTPKIYMKIRCPQVQWCCKNQAAFWSPAHESKSEGIISGAQRCAGGFPLDNVLTMICVGKEHHHPCACSKTRLSWCLLLRSSRSLGKVSPREGFQFPSSQMSRFPGAQAEQLQSPGEAHHWVTLLNNAPPFPALPFL